MLKSYSKKQKSIDKKDNNVDYIAKHLECDSSNLKRGWKRIRKQKEIDCFCQDEKEFKGRWRGTVIKFMSIIIKQK